MIDSSSDLGGMITEFPLVSRVYGVVVILTNRSTISPQIIGCCLCCRDSSYQPRIRRFWLKTARTIFPVRISCDKFNFYSRKASSTQELSFLGAVPGSALASVRDKPLRVSAHISPTLSIFDHLFQDGGSQSHSPARQRRGCSNNTRAHAAEDNYSRPRINFP